jgi:uncharacterized protein YgiM (DUF1202 family)
MKIWTSFIALTLFVLTACASPSNVSPTPTIVRLNHADATATPTSQAAEVAPTATTSLDETLPATATAPVGSESQAAPTATATAQAEIVAAELNVRQGAGVNYTAIGAASRGEVFNVIGVSANNDWLQIVTAGGQTGWISGKEAYTRVVGSLNAVPVIEASAGSAATATPVSQTATAADQSTLGKLVFTTGSGGDLYMINADGTDLRKLAGGVIDPVVSPNGQQVAFTRWDGAEMGTVYTLNLADGNERVVLANTLQAKSPTWSPDGQQLIVSFQHGGIRNPQEECRTFDADDGFQLPSNIKIIKMHFGANGLTVCFVRMEDLQWGLRQVDLATGQFEDLPADLYSFSPTWDPNQAWRVLYNTDKGLMQLDLAQNTRAPITSDTRDTGPVFSPDGQKLALTYQQHDHWEVYTYDLATGSRQRLTKPPILADPQYSSAAPAWSPDGSQIAFVTDRTGQYPEDIIWEIWVMNADGSNPHALFAPEVQAQLGLKYEGMNERMLNWIR